MANYQFNKDLKDGNEGEDFIVEWLKTQGYKVTLNRGGNNAAHDLRTLKDGQTLAWEVKTDFYCKPTRDTGNIFIEFWCRDKPSGIDTTQAHRMAYYFKFLKQVWIIDISDLRSLIDNHKLPVKHFSGDKGSGTSGYLIAREFYQDFFEVHNVGEGVCGTGGEGNSSSVGAKKEKNVDIKNKGLKKTKL